jgi:hypothetical protein
VPIRSRVITGNFEDLQAPAKPKKPFEESPRAVVSLLPREQRTRAGYVMYGHYGTEPDSIPLDDLVALARTPYNKTDNIEQVYRNRIKGRLSAIRAYCVTCVGGPKKVRFCDMFTCPLWAFRMGHNGLRGARQKPPEKKRKRKVATNVADNDAS